MSRPDKRFPSAQCQIPMGRSTRWWGRRIGGGAAAAPSSSRGVSPRRQATQGGQDGCPRRPTAKQRSFRLPLLTKASAYVLGTLAVLAVVGPAIPQAAAQGANTILELLQDIFAKTDALPADPASQSAVEAEMFTKVAMYRINSAGDDRDVLTCLSDRDMLVQASLHVAGGGGNLAVRTTFSNGNVAINNVDITQTVGLSFGAAAGDELTLTTSSLGNPDFVFALVTVQTAGGADVTCTVD